MTRRPRRPRNRARRQATSQRQQRWRENKRAGVIALRIVLARDDIELLVNLGFLAPEQRNNRADAADAAQYLLDLALVRLEEGGLKPFVESPTRV